MKTTISKFSLAALASLLPLSAEVQTTEKTTEKTVDKNGAVTKTETTTTTTFSPEARTKVVTYFDTYKGNPHGLPPGWVAKIKIKNLPTAWRTTRIEPGLVLQENQRSYLVAAPPELIKVLPSPGEGIRYYVAGSNVIAVDTKYKVVDSLHIPSIVIKVDDD
jgi:hypothetical protein